MNDSKAPAPFLRALNHRGYDNGGSDFTVTSLLRPPQVTYLATKYKPKRKSIYASYASLMGTTVHELIEKHSDPEQGEIVELRFFKEMHGFKISGQVDLLERPVKTVFDYKFVGGEMKEIKPDYYKQLHMNGYLAEENGEEVETVSLFVVQRDWSFLRSQLSRDYAQTPFTQFRYRYDRELAIREFDTRIAEHAQALKGKPRQCTDEEMWKKPTKWALIKPEGKRARKLCETEEEARSLRKGTEIIQKRPGEATFCKWFCDYSHRCPQFKTSKNED